MAFSAAGTLGVRFFEVLGRYFRISIEKQTNPGSAKPVSARLLRLAVVSVLPVKISIVSSQIPVVNQ